MRRVVVTRPASEAARWMQALQEQGWPVLGLPLIDIVPAAGPLLEQARAAWQAYDAVMFVSSAAVEHFFGATGVARGDGRARCWAPGPGTARALAAAGVPQARIDAPDAAAEQFDSEALWSVVAAQVRPGHRLLVVRGDSPSTAGAEPSPRGQGREWLARQCEQAGGVVDWCVAYGRQRPAWNDEQLAQAQRAATDGSVWLFSSSEAIANLRALLPGQDWHGACALVTHPRIADAARALGVGAIHLTRPALPDVVRGLESMT